MEKYLFVKEEVRDALKAGRPVVALESTIISHGMPYPRNLETALMAEKLVRSMGAVPATVGILEGKIHVGLAQRQIEALAESKEILKVSRKDLGYALAVKISGATTVCATMTVASGVSRDPGSPCCWLQDP
jgi:pseudouridine-5'-phosphate glycosidase